MCFHGFFVKFRFWQKHIVIFQLVKKTEYLTTPKKSDSQMHNWRLYGYSNTLPTSSYDKVTLMMEVLAFLSHTLYPFDSHLNAPTLGLNQVNIKLTNDPIAWI